MSLLSSLTASRRVTLLASATVLTVGVLGGGAAVAAVHAADPTPGPAIHTITPKTEKQTTNLDVDRQQIKNYYGDPLSTGIADPAGNYAKEAEGVEADALKYLGEKSNLRVKNKAILLDVDDTTLLTWNYEIASNFAYNPGTNATFVNGQMFPAVFGMVNTVKQAQSEGYDVFFLTGRGAIQEPNTLGNLTSDGIGVDAGYPAPTTLSDGEDGLFTKPAVADYPDYLKTACASDPNGSCTTIHYKSATRAHIESLGYDIVANFGDQYSDLDGGSSDRTFKMPNPTYFLP